MALQAQTSSDPDNLLFTAADCDDLNLSAAIGKFVFKPLAPELREAVGDGWVWLTALTKIDSIADPAERAEARQAFNRMKRQLPDYTEAEYMAVYAQKVDGRRFLDKLRDGDVLDILAFQKRADDLPSNKADFIWPTQLEVEDILPALHSLAELSERPADKNAIRSVARRITTRWHDLIEFLRRGELVAMGIRNHRERVSPEFWSDQKTRIDVLSARAIIEAIEWTDLRLFVMAVAPKFTKAAETKCAKWLIEWMKRTPDRPTSKEIIKQQAQQHFKGLSDKGFGRAWGVAVATVPAAKWDRHGAPRGPRNKNPLAK